MAVSAKPPVGSPALRGLALGDADGPGVLVMFDYTYDRTLRAPGFWEARSARPMLTVLLRSWEIRTRANLAGWPEKIAAHRARHPSHRLVYSANAPEELGVLREAGIEGVYCNHNAFVDEALYRPSEYARAGDAREFDAIYDARITRFKRHTLAARIPRLALIHYDIAQARQVGWMLWVRFRLRHARILNRHKGLWPRWMAREEVAAANNRAHVGLCLSEAEGAMLASIQYLLCGLPVVTTPSRGGRDRFFGDDNAITVEPDARAVAAGVREWLARKPDPWAIRAGALARIAEHRARFLALAREFQAEHGVPESRRIGPEWERRVGEVLGGTLS